MNEQQKQEFSFGIALLHALRNVAENRLAVQIKKDKPGIGWRNPSFPISSTLAGIRKDLHVVECHLKGDTKVTDERFMNCLHDIVIRLAHLQARRKGEQTLPQPSDDKKPKSSP